MYNVYVGLYSTTKVALYKRFTIISHFQGVFIVVLFYLCWAYVCYCTVTSKRDVTYGLKSRELIQLCNSCTISESSRYPTTLV